MVLNTAERITVAQAHGAQLATATGPVAMLLPDQGLGEWDRKGADLHDQARLDQFLRSLSAALPAGVERRPIAGHINDEVFSDTALQVFDQWCARDLIKRAGA